MKTTKMTRTEAPPTLALLGEGAAEDYEHGDPEKFVPSGLASLDDLILGAIAGELLLIAGAPGDGKTSLAMQWATRAAETDGKAAILSMEMGRRALRNRLVSGLTGIPMKVLRTRDWPSEKHRASAVQASEYLASIPLYVDDRSGLDPDTVYNTILAWKEQGIVLGLVDYVQRMGGRSKDDNRVLQVGDSVRALKSAAKDADMPIIAISSLNRAMGNEKPRLSRLRDSGDLEFEADTVLMAHYPEDDEHEDTRIVDWHVLKQRNGPTGVASMKFIKSATRFE